VSKLTIHAEVEVVAFVDEDQVQEQGPSSAVGR
jgi:hypothetical protein